MYRAPPYLGLPRGPAAPVPEPSPPPFHAPSPFEAPSPFGAPTPPPFPPPPARRRRSWGGRVLVWLVMALIWGTLALGALLLWFSSDLPRPESAIEAVRRPSLVLQDSAGRPFASFGDVVGEKLRLADLPPALPRAVVAVEDRRFWSHPGVDVLGIGRAVLVNLRAGRVVQGGSTITQQVAKNLFLSNARTFRRKVQELMLTFWLERHFTKTEILEIWLNRVYLGSGAWGVDAAAHIYFGTSARKLTLWQSAMLAGLPRAPSRFSPRVDPSAAIARTREVLEAMVEVGTITAAQAQDAAERITIAPRPSAGWFADWAAPDAQPLLPEDKDAVVGTTLNARLQQSAEQKLAALLDGPGAAAGVGQAAVVALDAASGAVRAMVGGRERGGNGFNRAVLAKRQPGSAFKPFVWLAALEAGVRPDDTVQDAPVRVGNWSPSNFDGKFRGAVTVESALAESLNTVAVRLSERAGGPSAVAAVARRLGLTGQMPDNATLALGTGEATPLTLAAAYAPFCNGGLKVAPSGIAWVRVDGRRTDRFTPPPARVVAPDLAGMMRQMLGAVVARGTGTAAALPGRLVVGKTGTTQESRDAWFVGCTGGVVMAVWLGNDDNSPMDNVTGGSLPARLFHDIAVDIR